jgi:hypothetical protein
MLVFVLWQAFHGLRKGIVRQGFKTGFTVVAALVAFFVTDSFTDLLYNIFTSGEQTVEGIVKSIEEGGVALDASLKGIILNMPPEVFESVLSLLFGVLLAPIVMLGLFFAVNFVLRIVYHIIKFIFRFPKGGRLSGRLIATFVGALHGFIVAAIILFPFIALSDIANETIEATIAATDDSELEEAYKNEISAATKNPTFAIVKTAGGDLVLNELATARAENKITLVGALFLGIKEILCSYALSAELQAL